MMLHAAPRDPATGAWRYVPTDGIAKTVGPTEAAGPNKDQFEEMFGWYRSLMRETFG